MNRFVYVTKGDSLGLKFGSKSCFQFLLMNISDITERYREDPQDARVLADRKVDVIIHVASADQKPDMALFDLIKTAVTRSKDQAVKRKYSRFTGNDRRWADTGPRSSPVEADFSFLNSY